MHRLIATIPIVLLFAGQHASAGESHLEFDVHLDAKPIGAHRFDVVRAADGTHTVSSVADFDVRFFGIPAYRYRHRATERWGQGCLVQIEASTNDNGRSLQVAGGVRSGRFQLGQGKSSVARDGCVISYAYWDPARLLRQRELLNPQTGQFDAVQFESIGEEMLVVRGAQVRADRFRLRSEKFTIDLWYSKSGEWLQLDSTTSSNRKLRYRQKGIVTTNSAPRSVSTSDSSPP